MDWTNGSLYGWKTGWTAGPRAWQSMMQQFIASWGKSQGIGAGLVQPGGEEAKGAAYMSNSHLQLCEGRVQGSWRKKL